MIFKLEKKGIKKELICKDNYIVREILIKNKIDFFEKENDEDIIFDFKCEITDKIIADILNDTENVIVVRNKSSRDYKKLNTQIQIGKNLHIGNGNFVFIAGPCSVESEEQILLTAKFLKGIGVDVLRGGAYKPRTSPYSFQGIGREAISLLEKAKKLTGLPIITEITSISQLEYFENVDIIQVGTRNMQNFELLKELGKLKKTVLLKRGFSATYKEFILSSEYILSGGNENVILCERGIRTFETSVRNTFDVTAVPYLKDNTHLPVIADPSHAVGISKYVPSIAKAAVAAGADGLMIEVHNNPSLALSDGEQSLDFNEFSLLKSEIDKIKDIV